MIENKKVPKIRFKGFTNDWEQRKVAEIGDNFSTGTLGYADLCDDGKYKCVLYGDLYTKFNERILNVKSRTNKEGTRVEINDLLFPTSTTVDNISLIAPSCVNQENIRVGGDLFGIRPYRNIDGNFVSYCINNFMPVKYSFAKQAQGLTIVHLQYNAIKNEELMIPTLDEQKKMSQLFVNIDNLITLHQRKYDKLVKIKSSLLEKMFPKNSSKIPEVRFKGFTEDWEQRKFDEMADYKKGPFGSALKKDIFVPKNKDTVKVYEQQNAINKNWKLERYFITKEYANKLKSFETHSGDIIISCAGTIGEVYELPSNSEPGIINQALMRVRVNENIVSKDLYRMVFLNMIDDFSKEHSNGSAMKNIPPFSDLKPMIALIPNNYEQSKISDFINNIDNLITLHQRKLDKLQIIKKSLLDKMFV